MESNRFVLFVLFIGAAACTPEQRQTAPDNTASPVNVAGETAPAAAPPTKVHERPNASLPEPKGPIDPKSVEAAGQVVQRYGALIEQRRWREAETLWSTPEEARKEAARDKRDFSEVHIEIGQPGVAEGAAGSVYVAIPGAYYGKFRDGKPFRHSLKFVLRRINEVTGSAPEQWRWHIERIESTEEF